MTRRDGLPGPGDLVLAAGVGVTGLPVVRYLAGTGATVVVSSNRPAPAELTLIPGDVTFAGDLTTPPDGTDLVITSAGIPPTNPLLAAALGAGIEVIDDGGAASLLTASKANLVVPILSGRPFPGALGVRRGMLVDNAFGADELLAAADIRPPGEHNVTNALAAAGLALAAGAPGKAVASGLRSFAPGGHRNVLVAQRS